MNLGLNNDNETSITIKADSKQLASLNQDLSKGYTYQATVDRKSHSLSLQRKKHYLSSALKEPDTQIACRSYQSKSHHEAETIYDRFSVMGTLGEGGSGTVYDALDNDLQRRVAVKVLRDSMDVRQADAFLREATIGASLEHPNLIPVHDVGTDKNGSMFLVMQKIDGEHLQDLCQRRQIADEELVVIMLKVCDALRFAHAKGLIHQDVKPENIVIGSYGEVQLIDWGAASAHEDELQVTPQYMSPQQARALLPDPRDDVYALGATLFFLLTDRYPTLGDTIDELWKKKQDGILDPLAPEIENRTSGPLLAIARKALRASADDRYQSVAAFAQDLTAHQSGYATTAEDASIVRQMRLFSRRNREASLTIALTLVTLFSVLGVTASVNYRERRKNQDALTQLYQAIEQRRHETTRRADVEGNRRKMESASAETQETSAMLLASNAKASVARFRFQDALEAIKKARELHPENPDYTLLKGLIEMRLGMLTAARVEFRKYAEFDPIANEFIEATTNETMSDVSLDRRERLMQIMTRSGVSNLGHTLFTQKELLARFKSQLEAIAPGSGDALLLSEGKLALHIHDNSQVYDLALVNGIPIETVSLAKGNVKNFGMIAYLPVTKLVVWATPIDDLSVLQACDQLEELSLVTMKLPPLPSLHQTNVTSISLSGYPHTPQELEPLRGLSLKTLKLNNIRIRSLEAIPTLPTERLEVAENFIADIGPLAGIKLAVLDLQGNPIKDISPLASGKFTTLNLSELAISDLTPLKNTGVKHLKLRSTRVTDLTPLTSLPLISLDLGNCRITDLSPLDKIPTLKEVILPDGKRRKYNTK